MKKNIFLITTNLETKLLKNSKNFYAGDWCLRFEKEFNHKFYKNNMQKNIWDNFSERKKDYKFIKKLVKEHSELLPDYFNKFHKKNYPKKFWQFLIFMWLIYYIPFQYFRWKTLISIFKKNKNLTYLNLNFSNNFFSTVDAADFNNLGIASDVFNYFHFNRMIIFLKKKKHIKVKIQDSKSNINFKKLLDADIQAATPKIKNNLLSKIKNFLNIILEQIFKINKNNNFFAIDVFNFKCLFLVNLLFRKFPVILSRKFNWYLNKKNFYKISINLTTRKQIKYYSKTKNLFNKYIEESISNDIPLCFLEGFNNLEKIVNKISINTKLILSSFKHYHDEIFRLWLCYEKFFKNKKIIFFEHGGFHHDLKLTFVFNYQELFSDKYLGWVKNQSDGSLPIPKFLFNTKNRKTAEYLTFIDKTWKPYLSRIHMGRVSYTSFKSISDVKILFSKLNVKPKSKFFYIPKINIEKIQYNEIEKIVGKNKILINDSFNEQLLKSKLAICTYPQTAFIESMITGPTILIYNYRYWQTSKKFKKIYKDMEKANIIFSDASNAADHINKNWDEIDKWWNEKRTLRARTNFYEQFDMPKKGSLKKWHAFINKNSEYQI